MKKIKLIVVFVIVASLAGLTLYFINRFSYSEKFPYYRVSEINNDSTLTIGIIGDSWVVGEKLDSLLVNEMSSKGYPCNVISSGHGGAMSKLIYQNLFNPDSLEHSSKFIIENHPKYCVVVAGVNDAAQQIGANNYSHHMIEIIKTLIHYNIKPVVISLPEFGIMEGFKSLDILRKSRLLLSTYINNGGELDNIVDYRKALETELEKSELKSKIIYIDFNKVCSDYANNTDLFKEGDPYHLSKKGNEKLVHVIVNNLTNNIVSLRQ